MGKTSPNSAFVGPTRFGEIVGHSRKWAREKLKEWLKEQEAGGPQRVFKRGKKDYLFTTIGVIQREFVGVHDPVTKRKLHDLEEQVTFLHKRIDGLSEVLSKLISRRAS
jgi:hypothetical protein